MVGGEIPIISDQTHKVGRSHCLTGKAEVVRRLRRLDNPWLQFDEEQVKSLQSDGRRPSPTPSGDRAPDNAQCKLP